MQARRRTGQRRSAPPGDRALIRLHPDTEHDITGGICDGDDGAFISDEPLVEREHAVFLADLGANAVSAMDDTRYRAMRGARDRARRRGGASERYDPAKHRLLTAASCTTNCLAPVVRVIHETLGIRHGQITTFHDPTNANVVLDAPHKDLRRARSAMLSLQPTTTGSATAIALIYPELKGRLDGHAVRAPVLNPSLTDAVFELKTPTTVAEVNGLFEAAASGTLAGILGYETRPLVSADYLNDPRSAIVDGPSTMVTDRTMLKVYAWYDNEVGYACRMVDLAGIVIARG